MKRLILLTITCMISLLIFFVDPVLSENRILAADIKDIREELEYYKVLLAMEKEMIENIIKGVREINQKDRQIKEDETVNANFAPERRASR